MPELNLRDLTGDIREALQRHTKESLIEILTYVFKEYVVQGPAPLAANAAPLRDDLEGLSFAEVIRSLQLRLDLPELALFEIQNDRVSLKVGGRQIPVETQASRPEPLPAPAPMTAPVPPAPAPVPSGLTTVSSPMPSREPAPSTRVEEARVAPQQPAAATQQAAPPPAKPAPAKPAAPAPAAKPDEGVAGSSRFGLLEIDD